MAAVRFQNRARTLMFLVVALVASSCAKGPGKPDAPPVSLIREALVGQEFDVGSQSIEILGTGISALQIVDTDGSADESSLTAAVTFSYSSDRGSFQVAGVVSFDRAVDGSLSDAYFETSSAR